MQQDLRLVKAAMETLEGCSLESTLRLLELAEFECLEVDESEIEKRGTIHEKFWSESKVKDKVIIVSFWVGPKTKVCGRFEVSEVYIEDAGFFK